MIGNLWMDKDNINGCKEFEQIFDGSFDPDTDPSPIAVVTRGGCSFVTKIRNAEHAGARLVLVIDDKDEAIENVIMVDDGNGAGIRIPAMLITKKDGETIKSFLLDKQKHIALLASFDLDRPDNRVEYDFWYTSSDDRALDFLRDYKEFHTKMEDKVLMTPHFAFWTCEKCDETVLKRDCYGNGAYCAINEKNLNTTGREILDEDI